MAYDNQDPQQDDVYSRIQGEYEQMLAALAGSQSQQPPADLASYQEGQQASVEDKIQAEYQKLLEALAQSKEAEKLPPDPVLDTPTARPFSTSEQLRLLAEGASDQPIKTSDKQINELTKAQGNKGFVFTRDEKGQMVITNTEDTRKAAGLTPKEVSGTPYYKDKYSWTPPTGVGEEGQKFGARLQAAIEAVKAASSSAEAQALYENLRGQAAEEKARIWQNAMEVAAVKLNIPVYEEQLKASETRDRLQPTWFQNPIDSAQTTQLRNHLTQARLQVDNLAKTYITGNVVLAGIDAQLKAAGTYVERHIKTQEGLDDFRQKKAFQQELKNEEIASKLLPEHIARASLVIPSLNGKPAAEIAQAFTKGIIRDEEKEAITAPRDSLGQLAILKGNKHAKAILIKEEAALTGRPEEDIAAQVKDLGSALLNKRRLEQDTTLVYRGDKQAKAAIDAAVQKLSIGTKEEKVAAREALYNLEIAAYAKKAEIKFTKDLSAWSGISNPELTGAIQKAKETTGQADLETVYKIYMGELRGPERRAKEAALIEAMRVAAESRSKGLLGAVDPDNLARQIKSLGVRHSLAREFLSKKTDELIAATDPFDLRSGISSGVTKLFGDQRYD